MPSCRMQMISRWESAYARSAHTCCWNYTRALKKIWEMEDYLTWCIHGNFRVKTSVELINNGSALHALQAPGQHIAMFTSSQGYRIRWACTVLHELLHDFGMTTANVASMFS